MKESALEALFTRYVRQLHGISIKIAPLMAGVPDRLVLLPGGRTYLVELKTEVGQVSHIQRVWHDRAGEIGHHVYVLHGKEEVLAWLDQVAG